MLINLHSEHVEKTNKLFPKFTRRVYVNSKIYSYFFTLDQKGEGITLIEWNFAQPSPHLSATQNRRSFVFENASTERCKKKSLFEHKALFLHYSSSAERRRGYIFLPLFYLAFSFSPTFFPFFCLCFVFAKEKLPSASAPPT